jgi:hypothetical protein
MQKKISHPFLRQIIDCSLIIVCVAAIHAFARYVQTEYLIIFNQTPLVAVFYLPAAVRVFSAIILGYWAAPGIALGLLIEITYLHPQTFTDFEIVIRIAQTGLGVCLSLLFWALISKKVTGIANPIIDFANIDAFDVLQMCLIQAVVNSTTAHLFYIWSPTIDHHFDLYYYLVMLVGDLTGAFFVFIIANIAFSIALKAGVISRKHYEDTMNSELVAVKK